MKNNGIITRQSQLSVMETIDKIADALSKNGVTIYARINQQAEAANVGIQLNPLEFILFGNPKRGGLVMKEKPVAALDLPLKIVAWQDDDNKTWVYYNESAYLQARFSLTAEAAAMVDIDAMVTSILQ